MWATAFWLRFISAWVSRWRSATILPDPTEASRQSRSASAEALANSSLGQVVEVDRLRLEEVRPARLRQEQQVVHEPGHAVELVGHQLERLAPLLGVVAHHVEVAADDRDRGAQLVARVADERLLARKRLLEPVEHLVEGAREVGELVVALDRDAPREIGLADRARGVAQQAQRREHAAGHRPGQQRGQHAARRC